ncbi:MAG: PD40 domain-containing protein [Bacteroidetes bacterium]|nr:PD40 domain-containing protein [Bacteroidota bacterium]
MKNLFTVLLLIFAVATAQFSYAQKKEKSVCAKADRMMDRGNYYEALPFFKKVYDKKSQAKMKAQAAYKAGECYRQMGDWKGAEEWYGKAAKANPKDASAVLWHAKALQGAGRYDESVAEYNAYKALGAGDNTDADAGIAASTASQAWKDKPLRYKIENISALNTKYYDYGTAISAGLPNTVYFTSSRIEAVGSDNDEWYGEKYYDIFKSTQDNLGKWSTPVPIEGDPNSKHSDGSICLDATGLVMYFTRAEKVKGTETVGKIYKSTFSNGKWGAPEGLPFNNDSITNGQPTLSADGQTMYFVSTRPGGYGGHDIWMSKNNGGVWGEPVNAGSAINTNGDEMFPVLHNNGKLYFSSNGMAGMGGLDLFVATNSNGSWGDVKNLKANINSSADDHSMVWISDTSGYITSGREGGQGQEDIYFFLYPPLILNVSGRVYDTDTKEPIGGATVELFGSDGTSLSIKTGPDGMYTYPLKENVRYKLSASYTGYLTLFHELSTEGLEENKEFNKDFDFPLKSTSKAIVLNNIYYDLDKWFLRPESKDTINSIVTTLNQNPTIVVEFSSHTDFRATDAYNQKLSERRAKSVVDYLISKGIPKARLAYAGKGESEPWVMTQTDGVLKQGDTLTESYINNLASEEDKEKAHQYNRRTQFKVLRTDYVPQ